MVLTSLEEGVGPTAAIELGVTKTMLTSPGRKAWDFVEDYRRENGKIPPPEALLHRVNWDPGTLQRKPDLTFKYICRLIIERTVRGIMVSLMGDVNDLLSQGDVLEAREVLRRGTEELNEIGSATRHVIEMFDVMPEVYESAQKYEQGMVGIESPFPTINEHSGGFHLGHTHYIMARPGTGKTWMLCASALHVYRQNYRCLFVSSEMPILDIATRMACIITKLSYSRLKKGELTPEEMQRLLHETQELQGKKNFLLIDDRQAVTKELVTSVIDRFDPDFVFIDSFYKLGQGRDLNASVQNAVPFVDACKRRGRSRGVICTGQLGRGAMQTDETTTMENIYGSDAVGQDGQSIWGMFASKEMRRDNQLGVKKLKYRDGTDHDTFYINFDLERMLFDELSGKVLDNRNLFSKRPLPGKFLGSGGLMDAPPKQQSGDDVVHKRIGGGHSQEESFNPTLKWDDY
jgi:archaellum biogenesis ATPase FlaH